MHAGTVHVLACSCVSLDTCRVLNQNGDLKALQYTLSDMSIPLCMHMIICYLIYSAAKAQEFYQKITPARKRDARFLAPHIFGIMMRRKPQNEVRCCFRKEKRSAIVHWCLCSCLCPVDFRKTPRMVIYFLYHFALLCYHQSDSWIASVSVIYYNKVLSCCFLLHQLDAKLNMCRLTC